MIELSKFAKLATPKSEDFDYLLISVLNMKTGEVPETDTVKQSMSEDELDSALSTTLNIAIEKMNGTSDDSGCNHIKECWTSIDIDKIHDGSVYIIPSEEIQITPFDRSKSWGDFPKHIKLCVTHVSGWDLYQDALKETAVKNDSMDDKFREAVRAEYPMSDKIFNYVTSHISASSHEPIIKAVEKYLEAHG
jgi:hypothetical protein